MEVGDMIIEEEEKREKKKGILVSVPRAETRVNRSGTSKFAAFVICIDTGNESWEVERRYSALFDFHSKAQARGLEAVSGRGFPGKQLIGTGLSPEQDARRLQALESYLQAVCAADQSHFLASFKPENSRLSIESVIAQKNAFAQDEEKARRESQLAARKSVLEAEVRRLSRLEAQRPSAQKTAAFLMLRIFMHPRPHRAFYRWYLHIQLNHIKTRAAAQIQSLTNDTNRLKYENSTLYSQLEENKQHMIELRRTGETQLIEYKRHEQDAITTFEHEAKAIRMDLESRLSLALSESGELRASLNAANKRLEAAEAMAAAANRNLEAELSAESTRADAQANLARAIDMARADFDRIHTENQKAHDAEVARLRTELEDTRNKYSEAMQGAARTQAIESQTWMQTELIRVSEEARKQVTTEYQAKLDLVRSEMTELKRMHESKLSETMTQVNGLEQRALLAEKRLLDSDTRSSSSLSEARLDFERMRAAAEESHKSHIERLNAQHDDTMQRYAQSHTEECARLHADLKIAKHELETISQAKTTAEARAYFAFADADNLAQAKMSAESRARAALTEAQTTKSIADESVAQADKNARIAQERIHELESQLEKASKDTAEAKSAADAAKKAHTALEAKLVTEVKRECEAISQAAVLASETQHKERIVELEAKVVNYENQMNKMHAELEARAKSESDKTETLALREEASADLETKLTTALSESTDLRTSLAVAQKRAEAAEAMAAAANRTLEAELSAETYSRAAAQTSLANAINETRAEFDRLLASAQTAHKTEVDRLRAELSGAADRESQHRNELDAARSALETSRREKAAAEAQAQLALTEAEKVRATANELVQAKAAADMRANIALADAKSARSTIESLTEAKLAAEARAQAMLSEGQHQVSAENMRLTAALSEAETQTAEVEAKYTAAEQSATKRYHELETRLAAVLAESNTMRQALDAATSRADSAESDAASARAVLDQFRIDVVQTQTSEIERIRSEFNHKESKQTEALVALQEEYSEMTAALAILEKAKSAAEEGASRALEQVRELEEAKAISDKRSATAELQVQELTQSMSIIEAERSDARTDAASARTVADEVKKQFLKKDNTSEAQKDSAQLRLDLAELETTYKTKLEASLELTTSLQTELTALEAKHKSHLDQSDRTIKRLEAAHTALGVEQIKSKADLDHYSAKLQEQASRETELLQYAVDLKSALNNALAGDDRPAIPKTPRFVTSIVPSPLINVDTSESFSVQNISDLAIKVARQPLAQIFRYKPADMTKLPRGITSAASKAVANSNICEISSLAMNAFRDMTSDDLSDDEEDSQDDQDDDQIVSAFNSPNTRPPSAGNSTTFIKREQVEPALSFGTEEMKDQEESPTIVRYSV